MLRGYTRGRRAECRWLKRGVPFVDATNEQATLIEDEDGNNNGGNDGAAVVKLQVPAQDNNAQRSEVPLADALLHDVKAENIRGPIAKRHEISLYQQ